MGAIGTYGFVNAKVRAMRSFLLDSAAYQRMAETPNLKDFFSVLSQTSYHDVVEKIETESPIEIEKEFIREEFRRGRILEKNSRGQVRKMIVLFLERFDVQKVQQLLRIWYHKESDETVVIKDRVVYDIPWDSIASADNLEEIAEQLNGTPFSKIISNTIPDYEKSQSIFSIELAIERDYFERLRIFTNLLRKKDMQIARKIFGIEVDIRNLGWLSRFQKYYQIAYKDLQNLLLPHGYRLGEEDVREISSREIEIDMFQRVIPGFPKEFFQEPMNEENFQQIEHFLNRILLAQARKLFIEFPFSIGSLLGYLVLLEIETKNLICLLQAKLYGLSAQDSLDLLIV